MQQQVISRPLSEADPSEPGLHQEECHPLHAATGFVIGSALSGAIWTVAGLIVWYLV
jgi:hypothetical protein